MDMLDSRYKKLVLLIAICSLLFIIPVTIYMSRSPVLIVTDLSFYELYGSQRLRQQRQKTSRQLFRRLIPVYVAESAGSDLIAIAAEDAYDRPRAVIFPHRYQEGAAIYKENHPQVEVLVIGGPQSQNTEPFLRVRTNTKLDLYRAGLSAALLAGDQGILFIGEVNLADEYREAFQAGLLQRGFLEEPIYIGAYSSHPSFSPYGCVIVAGPAIWFLEQNLDIPVILFSWANSALTPNSVKLVFNDSSWVLAARAIRAKRTGEGDILLGSEPTVLKDRVDKSTYRMINRFVKTNFN